MSIKKYNLEACFDHIKEYWDPHVIGELNDQQVKLAKIKGFFDWHAHDHEDELFLVIMGEFTMELRDRNILLQKGDMVIIPKGTEHRPVAPSEAHILLFEPKGTLNTGNVQSELTRSTLKSL